MSIVRIAEFQKVYPKLWDKINEVREQTGSNALDKDYSEHFTIPIRMYDAALAEAFLEKEIEDHNNPKEVLGFINLQKILNAVSSEPNMSRWLDILYYPNNPKGLYSDRYNAELKIKKHNKKEPTMAKVRNQVEGEIIVNVSVDANSFLATGVDGTDYTNEINQKKLKYAWTNKGVIRGSKNANDEIVWRVVKEKYVTPETVMEPEAGEVVNVQPTVSA